MRALHSIHHYSFKRKVTIKIKAGMVASVLCFGNFRSLVTVYVGSSR
jgi:hypothetical protein